MNTKLFKKLNEQIEINQIKKVELTESEIKRAEEKLIFESFVKDTEELLRAEDDEENHLIDEQTLTEELINEGLRQSLLKRAIKHMKEDKLNKLGSKIFEKIRKDNEKKADQLKSNFLKSNIEKKREFLLKVIDIMKDKNSKKVDEMESKLEDKISNEQLTEGFGDYFTTERGKVAMFGALYLLAGTAFNILLAAIGGSFFIICIPAWIALATALFGTQEAQENHFINNRY